MARILFVSGYYPPFAPVGAVRPGKLAAHWAAAGHQVRVLAIRNVDLWRVSGNAAPDATPPPAANRFGQAIAFAPQADVKVAHLPWSDGPDAAPAPATDGPAPASAHTANAARPGPLARLRTLYQQYRTTPDRYARWVKAWAVPAAALARDWPADLVYSSGPPQSSHRLASAVARIADKPWIAELRDLWVGNPYDDRPAWLRARSARIADATLSHAAGFVCVTAGAGRTLAARYGKPVQTAFNGFDPTDYAGLDHPGPLDAERLTILHAGVIYAGRRDARPLLEAIASLAPPERARVLVRFHHDEGAYVARVVADLGLQASVEFLPLVPRSDILAIERAADIVLLCRWADPREDDVIPGKLFEYIGARRQILSVGSETGEAADIVRAGNFGLVSNDPPTIAAWLQERLAEKPGRLPDLPGMQVDAYDRRHQFARIDAFARQLGIGL